MCLALLTSSYFKFSLVLAFLLLLPFSVFDSAIQTISLYIWW